MFKHIMEWLRHEKRVVYVEYGLLALMVMLPLLLPGFILTLDLVFTPNIAFPSELTNTYPLQLSLWLLNLVLPADIVEKIVLFSILVLSGAGAHRLARAIPYSKTTSPAFVRWGAYFAGIFYMINPFTYARFMAGQWMVLLGYALLPFFVLTLIRFIARPGKRTAFLLALWAAIISAVSIHHTGIMLIILLVALSLGIWRYWGTATCKRLLGWTVAGIGILLVLCSYWLIPTLAGGNSIADSTATFDNTHHEAFATTANGPFGAIGNVVRLQGFWVEDRALYALPQDRLPGWGLLVVALWALVGLGAITAWRTQRFIVLLFGITGFVGLILAATPVISWVSDLIPLASGYREPHKFANLVVLAYAGFGAIGVVRLFELAHTRWGEGSASTILVLVLLLPIALAPTMLWGFGRQLAPKEYPPDWFAVNNQLKTENKDAKVLFLPWHQYMHFDFAGRIIANPADKFFDADVLVSDDPEFKDIRPNKSDTARRRVAAALHDPDTLPKTLADLDIRYILLAKEQDDEKYAYLDTLPELMRISDTKTLRLYKIENIRP